MVQKYLQLKDGSSESRERVVKIMELLEELYDRNPTTFAAFAGVCRGSRRTLSESDYRILGDLGELVGSRAPNGQVEIYESVRRIVKSAVTFTDSTATLGWPGRKEK